MGEFGSISPPILTVCRSFHVFCAFPPPSYDIAQVVIYIVNFRSRRILGVEEIGERAHKVEMGTHYAARNLIVWHPSVHVNFFC
jgi:hypothetical protein